MLQNLQPVIEKKIYVFFLIANHKWIADRFYIKQHAFIILTKFNSERSKLREMRWTQWNRDCAVHMGHTPSPSPTTLQLMKISLKAS